MILDSFRSEWVKLRRRTLLFGTFGGLALAASFFVILTFSQAAPTGPGSADLPSLQSLAQPNGLIHGLSRAVILLGIVAFGIAAAQIANEYSLGTLRQLLVRQPRRAVLLVGKYLAVMSFLVAAVVFAAVVSGVAAVVLAHVHHVPIAAWFSSAGVADLTRALGQLLLAVVGFGTLGLAVGLFLRSPVFAVIVGFAYLIPFENVLTRIVPSAGSWLPGQLLGVVGQGGTTTVGFSRALLLSALYLVAIGILSTYAFMRRDVTA
jgi:ABC-type transport system involved in multi-copper enzyme maturation permease subunit